MLLVVGRVGRAHGVKGEVTVEVRTDEPETRLAPGSVLLTDPPERGPLTVRTAHVHSGRLLVRFDGVDDRTAAEALRGTLLLVDVDPAAPPDEDDAWYDHQLVGLAVVDTGGAAVGEVARGAAPAGPGRAGGRHDRTAPRCWCRSSTRSSPRSTCAAGRVVVDPPSGLLDDRDAVVAGRRLGRRSGGLTCASTSSRSSPSSCARWSSRCWGGPARPGWSTLRVHDLRVVRHRPAPHRRRHPVRRRRRHGHEARAVGRRAGRPARRPAGDRGTGAAAAARA